MQKKQKVCQASKVSEPSLEELKEKFNLPDDTKSLGYAVYREESDEFLAEFDESIRGGIVRIVWARIPEMAICYDTLNKAVKISKQCNRSSVIRLFDTGKQIVTVTMPVS